MPFELTPQETTTGPGITRGRLAHQIRECLKAEHRSLVRQDSPEAPEQRAMLRVHRHRLEAKLQRLDDGTPPPQEGPTLFDEETL